MNYHPTNDYPINLEDVFKMIGFANKENAKRTLKNNFTKDEDYKILLVRTDERVHGLKISKRTCKKVSKCDSETGHSLQTWESLTIASKETGIPRSTLAHIIKFKMIKEI
jgi:hypothetical protein